MQLRDFIRAAGRRPIDTVATATVATLATVRPVLSPSVATVARVAAYPRPEEWPARFRVSKPAELPVSRWHDVADALERLLATEIISRALALGWDARELIGLQRFRPYDHPLRAGLVFSLRSGDVVRDVGRDGCIIAHGNVRHIWRRVLLADSIVPPWDLAAWLAERGSHAA